MVESNAVRAASCSWFPMPEEEAFNGNDGAYNPSQKAVYSLPNESCTVAASLCAKAVLIAALWGFPPVAAMEAAAPA
jgi:hypothetical protein